MFGLIRRLSYSVIPRPDRPWEDDPTSNAPHKPRKRRLSTSEQEDANSIRQTSATRAGYVGESVTKKARGEAVASTSAAGADEFGAWSVPQHQEPCVSDDQDQTPPDATLDTRQEQTPETQDVKDVTQGVKEVELEDKEKKNEVRGEEGGEVPENTVEEEVHPESVPLPDEDEVDELDDDSEETSKVAGITAKTDVVVAAQPDEQSDEQVEMTTIPEQSRDKPI
jgi:hypothetical protein